MVRKRRVRFLTCRVLLFFQMLGFKSVWGCEHSYERASNAKTAIQRTYREMVCPSYLISTRLALIHACLFNVKEIPLGAAVIFSFWETIPVPTKERMGYLASRSDSFRMLCIVQFGTAIRRLEEELHSDFGFPRMKCMWHGPVRTSQQQHTCYILLKQ